MPEFSLKTTGVVAAPQPVAFFALPLLAQGYIKALFWTNTDGSREDGTFDPETGSSLPEEVGYSDLAGPILQVILEDCAAFETLAAEALEEAGDRGYSDERAGVDFWLTRSGSGVSFADRSELGLIGEEAEAVAALFTASNEAFDDKGDTPEYRALWQKALTESKRLEAHSPGARLDAIARTFGGLDVYLGDDGKVYF